MPRKILNPDEGHPYYFLGAVLALLAAMYPILGIGQWGLVTWTLSFWVVLVAAIHATGRRRHPLGDIFPGAQLLQMETKRGHDGFRPVARRMRT